MLSYCLKCKKTKQKKNRNAGTMILSKCSICGTKKSRFIKKKEAKEQRDY